MKIRIDELPKAKNGANISATEASKLLKQNEVRGKKLTRQQQKYFGWASDKKKSKKAADGMQLDNSNVAIQDNKFTPITPDTIQLNGNRHKDGGQMVNYKGDGVEAEGTETLQKNPDGSASVMGNMFVPGTKSTFKKLSVDFANKQKQLKDKYINPAVDLINDNDPTNQWEQLAYNSGKAMLQGGVQKYDQLQQNKEFLGEQQQAILDIAKEHNLDPDALSKGKVDIPDTTPQNDTPIAADGMDLGVDGNNDGGDGGKSIAQRNNNPGNMKYASWMADYGAVPGTDKTENDGTVYAKFPTLEQGQAAMQHLLFSGKIGAYKPDADITTALNTTYTNNQPYADKLMAPFKGKTFGDLKTPEQQTALLNAITQGEDSKTYNWTDVNGNPIKPTTTTPAIDYTPVQNVDRTVIPDTSNINFGQIADAVLTGQVDAPTATTPNPKGTAPAINYTSPKKSIFSQVAGINGSNKTAFNPLEVLPELQALKNNQVQGVFQQDYKPELYQPYQVSYQDAINNNQRNFNAERLNPYLANNPTALSVLAGQTSAANNQVSAEQFRANQAIANDISNKNISLLNEAQATNLKLQDQAYVRQQQAESNTKAINYKLMTSIADKILQHQLENKQLQAVESATDYRYGADGKIHNYSNATPNDLINWQGINPAPEPQKLNAKDLAAFRLWQQRQAATATTQVQ